MKPETLPLDDLQRLGEKLQQALLITRARLHKVQRLRLKVQAQRVVDRSDSVFHNITVAVQLTQHTADLLRKAFGVTYDDLLELTGNHRAAHGLSYTGLTLLNKAIEKSIDDLAKVNAAIDKEQEHGEAKK